MTRSFLPAVLATLALCAPPAAAGDFPAATAADNPLWFALRVNAGGGQGSGTPVYSGEGRTLVLTNAHVARPDRTAFTVSVPGGATYPARRVDGSGVRDTGPGSIAVDGPDLAVLEVDAELGAVTIAPDLPAPGSPVYLWGHGGGQPAPLKAGHVTANHFAEPTLTATLTAIPGDSGAGVFDARGRLVGVNHGTGAGHGMHAVPLPVVRTFLSRPVLARLFPRLADRLALRAPPPPPVAEPVAPPPAPAAPACRLVPVVDARGRVVGWRQQCPLQR